MWNGGSSVAVYGILVPPPGIEPRPPELGARSLSHWTTREVLWTLILLAYLQQESPALGNSLLVQWLGLGSSPGREIAIPKATGCDPEPGSLLLGTSMH